MSDAYVFTQTIFVFKALIAVLACPWRIRCWEKEELLLWRLFKCQFSFCLVAGPRDFAFWVSFLDFAFRRIAISGFWFRFWDFGYLFWWQLYLEKMILPKTGTQIRELGAQKPKTVPKRNVPFWWNSFRKFRNLCVVCECVSIDWQSLWPIYNIDTATIYLSNHLKWAKQQPIRCRSHSIINI